MRWTRAALLATSSLTVLLTAACGAGPSQRPGVAVERPHQAGAAPSSSTTTPAGPPPAQVPKTDLNWHDCAATTFNQLGLGAPPPGLVFECAQYSAPIDAGGTVLGTFRTGAVRARLPQTPADAAPLVLTSGSDRSSTATLAGLASGPAAAVLAAHPVVAVDRRGLGSSQPIDCMPTNVRGGLAAAGQNSTGGDPVDTVARISQDATVACQDFLQPYQGTLDASHAADDLEQLRKQWQVDRIALLGTGDGGRVALAYAAKYGDHLARLVLDAPTAVGADQVTRAEQQVKGAEAALTGFAQRCAAVGCSLGPNPKGAVADLVNRARSGDLPGLSAGELLTAIGGFLSEPRADQPTRVGELADALSAAGNGNVAPMTGLVSRELGATAGDGQFVARCSDNQQPVTPDRAKTLENTWATQYPVFGRDAAARLMACVAWPVPSPAQLPTKLNLPVLVLGSAADPVAGSDALPTVTGALGRAGATDSTVMWQGWGHPVFTHSGCAQHAIADYLKDAKLPADGTACPA
ncbi:alpha/beta hydrolase [Nocardia terpenica]|uniref:Alpha/beta fold hydrolase n=1 Tax=Nocardia terpenica TaxID=455432 RepID=A0A6G9Z6G1_9NOCA|nr:alpha/beta hydrolase [Nocardia terpenica]QIS21179.1 alpha/beta fold hydrolase [Nocardia terpenica]